MVKKKNKKKITSAPSTASSFGLGANSLLAMACCCSTTFLFGLSFLGVLLGRVATLTFPFGFPFFRDIANRWMPPVGLVGKL